MKLEDFKRNMMFLAAVMVSLFAGLTFILVALAGFSKWGAYHATLNPKPPLCTEVVTDAYGNEHRFDVVATEKSSEWSK